MDDIRSVETLRQNWWALAIRGAVAIIFGVVAIIWPSITLFTLIILFGAYALIDGVFNIIAAIRAAERKKTWWPLLLEGVAGVIIGIVAWLWPGLTALALLYLIGAWAIITGVFEVIAAVRLRRVIETEWLLGVSGVISILWGLALVVFPISGALAVVWLIGIFAIIFGVALLALAFRLRGGRSHEHQPGRPAGLGRREPA